MMSIKKNLKADEKNLPGNGRFLIGPYALGIILD